MRYIIGLAAFLIIEFFVMTLYAQKTVHSRYIYTQPQSLISGGSFTSGAMHQYLSSKLNSCDPVTELKATQGGQYSTEAVTGCVAEPPGASILQSAGIAGYANTSADSSARTIANAAGGYFQCRSLANNSACWGINPLVQDVRSLSGHWLTGEEIDVNQSGSPAGMWGLLITGIMSGNTPADSWAIDVSPTMGRWRTGIQLADGAIAGYGMILGSTATSANSGSQALCFSFRDSGNASHCGGSIFSDSAGDLSLNSHTNLILNGPTYLGSATSHLVSGNANPATAGVIRLASGDSVCWRNARNTGNLCSGVGSVELPASLTTTSRTSDTVTVTGMTASGHCSLTPTNSGAASNIATTYVSSKTIDQITVTHTATAGMTYDVMCTPD